MIEFLKACLAYGSVAAFFIALLYFGAAGAGDMTER